MAVLYKHTGAAHQPGATACAPSAHCNVPRLDNHPHPPAHGGYWAQIHGPRVCPFTGGWGSLMSRLQPLMVLGGGCPSTVILLLLPTDTHPYKATTADAGLPVLKAGAGSSSLRFSPWPGLQPPVALAHCGLLASGYCLSSNIPSSVPCHSAGSPPGHGDVAPGPFPSVSCGSWPWSRACLGRAAGVAMDSHRPHPVISRQGSSLTNQGTDLDSGSSYLASFQPQPRWGDCPHPCSSFCQGCTPVCTPR